MNRHAVISLISGLILLAGTCSARAVEILDPHKEPARCLSCHTATPTVEDIENGELLLHMDGIDETCHMCHPYDCCRIYALKGHNHPSNVGKWDVEHFTEPETLPLFDGFITCNTCHFHRQAQVQGDNYFMVRIVRVGLDRVDWTALCHDCHVDY
ncbi:MAG: hypothetical protein P1S46_11580 [bacterium]|nr:hypothetical protein [bacterium]